MAEAGGKRSCRETSAGGRRKVPRVEDEDREEGLMEGVRCGVEFFDQPCEDLASALLGCVLVCLGEDGVECRGVVVEAEAYLGGEDRAAHSYNGRRSRANAAMYMVSEGEGEGQHVTVYILYLQAPGTAYVYSIYGMHCCFNVSSQGEGAAVLVRALCPVAGLETMRSRRGWKEGGKGKQRKDSDLCNGPGKLCQAMGITKQ